MMKNTSNKGWNERCQRCSTWHPAADLLMQLHQLPALPGENRLPVSEPANGVTTWTCSSTYIGEISHASSSYWIRVNDDNTVTHVEGAPTWVNSGTIEADGTNVIDASTWTTIHLAARIGVNEVTGGTLTVTCGVSNGATDYPMRTAVSVAGMLEVFGSIAVSTIDAGDRSALTPYFSVTTSAATTRWWIAGVHIAKDSWGDMLKRGVRITTSGTAIVRTAEELQLVPLVTCKKCRRKGTIELANEWDWEPSDRPDIREDLEVER